MKSIILPDTVSSIEESAFDNCQVLSSIAFPKSLSQVGDWAFFNCTQLTSIDLRYVTTLGDLCFAACTSLKHVAFGYNNLISSIPDSAFDGCASLQTISLPDSVTSIGSQAFYRCSNLTNVSVSKNVVSIGMLAFAECTNLEKLIVLPPLNPPSIGTNILYHSNKAVIYVKYPEVYRPANGWSLYSNRIRKY